MADLSSLGSILPSKDSLMTFGANTFQMLTIFVIALIFIIGIGIGLFLFLNNKRYNKKLVIFKKINNHFEKIANDKAMEVKFGSTGDSVIFTKKYKKYLPLPEIQSGRNEYWYAIREDGEWINIGLEDVDFKMKQVKANFLRPEIRAWRTAFQSNLKQRLEKTNFMDKYGNMMFQIVTFIICGVILWFVADRLVAMVDKIGGIVKSQETIMNSLNGILSNMNNLCSNSGVRHA